MLDFDDGGGVAVGFDEVYKIGGLKPDSGGIVAGVNTDDTGAFGLGIIIEKILIEEELNLG